MIRMEVIEILSGTASSSANIYARAKEEELAKVEDFIAKIGYDNIKSIHVAAPNFMYCTIFYEDGMPFSSRLDNLPPKKKLFEK